MVKFIPSGDSDFAFTAGGFAAHLSRHHEQCNISREDSAEVTEAVKAYREALSKTLNKVGRTHLMTIEKNQAREKAEQVVRRIADIIRADKSVISAHKVALRIKERPKKLKKRKCPQHPPRLTFMGPGDGVEGVHVLKYCESDDYKVMLPSGTYGMNRKAKPDGAARLELYVELIPLGEPIPQHPFERMMTGVGSWPLHLRAFTKNPIEAEYPVPAQPCVCVYWARWSSATGEMSRWSQPCVSPIVGYVPGRTLPGAQVVPAIAGAVTGEIEGAGRAGEVKVTQGSGLALPEGDAGFAQQSMQMRCLILHAPNLLLGVGEEVEEAG